MSRAIASGILGCGVIAPTHVQSYAQLDGVTVRWACDLALDRARRLADKFGIPNATTDYRDVLADPAVDCVSICTDHASHAELTANALAAGKHVLCEKALATSAAGLDRMLAAHAARPDLVFSAVFQHRFDRGYRLARHLLREGAFGSLLNVDLQMSCYRSDEYYAADAWRGTWAGEGGSLAMNQAIHYIDLLAWMTGGVEAVCATWSNRTHAASIETEDTLAAALRYRCGALGTITATSSSNEGWRVLLGVRGSAGTLEIRNDAVTHSSFRDPERASEVDAMLAAGEGDGPLLGKSYYGAGHVSQIADFIEAIRTPCEPYVSARSARETVDLVLALYESAAGNRWVTL